MPSAPSSPSPADAAAAAGSASAPHVAIVATSLSSRSRSQRLAEEALRRLRAADVSASLVNLAEHPLPLAGSDASWSDPGVKRLQQEVSAATQVLFAVPIYNFDVNAAAKNFVELMGEDVLGGKTVGFLCTAGGAGSFMSVMSFANSLMLDFRCWIVPRFLYLTNDFVAADGTVDPELDRRLDGLIQDLLTRGLARPAGA